MSDARDVHKLAAALDRMADKAIADGCTVLGYSRAMMRVSSADAARQAADGGYIVILTPGPLHGCDCPGYERHGYCKHYALALDTAGWLPVDPDPDDTVTLTDAGRAALATMRDDERRQVAAADLAARRHADGDLTRAADVAEVGAL